VLLAAVLTVASVQVKPVVLPMLAAAAVITVPLVAVKPVPPLTMVTADTAPEVTVISAVG